MTRKDKANLRILGAFIIGYSLITLFSQTIISRYDLGALLFWSLLNPLYVIYCLGIGTIGTPAMTLILSDTTKVLFWAWPVALIITGVILVLYAKN